MTAVRSKGYPVFTTGDYNINTVGFRANNPKAGKFDDVLCHFYKVGGIWQYKAYKATTDPGLTYLQNPLNAKGCAILVPGFYDRAYQLGLHKGKPALRQAGTLKVYRDNNRDAILDMDPRSIEAGNDMFCNIHYSTGEGQLDVIGPWSAGCQVLSAGVNTSIYQRFLKPYVEAVKLYGNHFSYALLTESDYQK